MAEHTNSTKGTWGVTLQGRHTNYFSNQAVAVAELQRAQSPDGFPEWTSWLAYSGDQQAVVR